MSVGGLLSNDSIFKITLNMNMHQKIPIKGPLL